MDVLSSRILIRPRDFARSAAFYGEVLGLKIYREWRGGVVFFLGGGFLEVSGRGDGGAAPSPELWLQVEDLAREYRRLSERGVPVVESPERKPWGLDEMRIDDPDGVRLILVEVPPEHPLRRR